MNTVKSRCTTSQIRAVVIPRVQYIPSRNRELSLWPSQSLKAEAYGQRRSLRPLNYPKARGLPTDHYDSKATDRPPNNDFKLDLVLHGGRVKNTRSRLDSILYKLEMELRRGRLYDEFEMDSITFWDEWAKYKAIVEEKVQSGRTYIRKIRFASQIEKFARSITTEPMNADRHFVMAKMAFYNHIMDASFDADQLERHAEILDCRYPMEWFPSARRMKRKLFLHVGPTNSGKTYNALKRLEEANSGFYAGPLRLLAQEIWARMNAKGKPTFLMTGDDQQGPTFEYTQTQANEDRFVSCTVEMLPLSEMVDVAVIDEVQMAADKTRGHAWTSAIIGVCAREVHMCGEERTVPIIQEIARSLGEELVINRYTRLSPLEVAPDPLRNMGYLQKGDCVVCFSVLRIHNMKQEIEKITGKRCAMIYGNLPAEVRSQQARLFNDPDNEYDYLVATDAVGMGLNLAIGRIIFDSVHKRTKEGPVTITTPEIKQIGGRAGRFRTSFQNMKEDAARLQSASATSPDTIKTSQTTVNSAESTLDPDVNTLQASSTDNPSTIPTTEPSIYPAPPPPVPSEPKPGLVTAFEKYDLAIIRKSMSQDPPAIEKIGVFPTNDQIEMLYTYFPYGTPYSFILARILGISRVAERFFFCETYDVLQVADAIQSVRGMVIQDRIRFCFAPTGKSSPATTDLLVEMATAVATSSGGSLLELKSIDFSVMDEPVYATRDYLSRLEDLHRSLVLYNWMSFRFPGVFHTRPLCFKAKEVVEANIDKCLTLWSFVSLDKTRVRKRTGKNEILLMAGEEDEEDVAAIPEDDAATYSELEEELEQSEGQTEEEPSVTLRASTTPDTTSASPAVELNKP